MKKPKTATEIQFKIKRQAQMELLGWLLDGGLTGKEIELEVGHYLAGNLGTITCEVLSWTPLKKNL